MGARKEQRDVREVRARELHDSTTAIVIAGP